MAGIEFVPDSMDFGRPSEKGKHYYCSTYYKAVRGGNFLLFGVSKRDLRRLLLSCEILGMSMYYLSRGTLRRLAPERNTKSLRKWTAREQS
jgi:hypothetical protein